MKAPALSSLNTPVDNGATRTREQWQRWGEKRLSESERRAGWVCVVGFFQDAYYRVNFAAQPRDLRLTPRGKQVRFNS